MKKNIFGWRLEFHEDPTYVGDIFVEEGEEDDEVPKSSHPPIRITKELLARAKALAALTVYPERSKTKGSQKETGHLSGGRVTRLMEFLKQKS